MFLKKNKSKNIKKLSGWGGNPVIKAVVKKPISINELKKELKIGPSIARGNGRSYGDSAINRFKTIDMCRFNLFIDFNEDNGLLVVQSGVLISDIIKTFLTKGWFLHVTPGTKFATIGGLVASDVHGKNHYNFGTFSNYVEWIDILNSEGEVLRCSRKDNSELFKWTFGGMGLTGIILNIAFYLRPVETSYINQKQILAKNLKHAINVFEDNLSSTYIAAWIDCQAKGDNLGRSIIFLGEHAKLNDLDLISREKPLITNENKKLNIPIYFPNFILNKFSIKFFNFIFYLKAYLSPKKKIIECDNYFYPLDQILNWNRIYGRRGFSQFQCVIPLENSHKGLCEILETLSKLETTCFLAVLKRFGEQNNGLSFPMEGYSLALDFPLNNKNLLVINKLEEITLKYGGRFYLAKDSVLKKDTFDRSDKRVSIFRLFRKGKLSKSFSSVQSERLDL